MQAMGLLHSLCGKASETTEPKISFGERGYSAKDGCLSSDSFELDQGHNLSHRVRQLNAIGSSFLEKRDAWWGTQLRSVTWHG